MPTGAYESESLNNEIKRIITDDRLYTNSIYPLTIKPNFSTLGPNKETSNQRPVITFVPDYNIRDLQGIIKITIYEEYNLSQNPVDILSFDIFFLECDIAQGKIYKGKRSVVFHKITMDVDSGYKYIEKLRGGVQWYLMESKNTISNNSFKLKNENNQPVSFNGQNITFRLSIKEIYILI